MVKAIPGFGDVICSRDENGIQTNVPCRITRHSPDGFEWGYGGSGPSDFALNILSVFIGQEASEKDCLYQDFKREFIAILPRNGGTIAREKILAWVEERIKREVNHG